MAVGYSRRITIDLPYEDYTHLAEVAAQITEGHRKRAGQRMLRGWRVVTVCDVARVAICAYLDTLAREMRDIETWQANAIAGHEATGSAPDGAPRVDAQASAGEAVAP